jgi:benzoyl-CoA reductase subunit C
MSSLEALKRYYQERDLGAESWRKQGGKVVMYWCSNVPEEIIHAAGMLPVRITGNPLLPTSVGDLYMEESYCTLVRAIFDQILRGTFNKSEAIVIPHACDAVIRGAKYLWTVKALDGIEFPEMYWVEMPHDKNLLGYEFYVERLRGFRTSMEKLSGRQISDDDLNRSIDVYNRNRAVLQKAVAFRRSHPPRISGTEALTIIGAGMFMPKEEHTSLLERLLEEVEGFPAKDSPRLFLSGSGLDNTDVMELIESCGTVVVGDDMCTGDRCCENLVEERLDPIEALAHRYLRKAPCPRMMPLADKVEDFRRRIEECQPDGVIFYLLRWCDSLMWDYVALRDELAKFDIPHYYLDMQEYRLTNPESLKTRIEALTETMQV